MIGIRYCFMFAGMIGLFGFGCSTTMSPSKKAKILERIHYVEYTGKQLDWPIATSGMVNVQATKYGLPIYHSLPNKPYNILGTIQDTRGNMLKHAAEAAQATGADALLVCKDPAFAAAGLILEPKITFRGTGSGKMDLLQGILIRWSR